MEDFDSTHDADGTLDDQFFYDHYGKQPSKKPGGGKIGGGFIPLFLVGVYFLCSGSIAIGVLLIVISVFWALSKA